MKTATAFIRRQAEPAGHLALRFLPVPAIGALSLGLLAMLIGLGGCDGRRQVTFAGKTMGTTYHVKVVAGWLTRTGHLQPAVEKRLAEVNQSMSTYLKDSEISRFNAHRQTDAGFAASADFLRVMSEGRRLHELSGGAWDGTVDPLVTLWGFGRSGPVDKAPAPDRIRQALDKVGFSHFAFGPEGRIFKDRPDVTVDLGSIAKGFGVDAVAKVLREAGFDRFIVEIGGEVYTAGLRRDNRPWKVGINRPQKDAALDSVYKTVALSDKALATSGDYRQFFEQDGRRYSHLIDPLTGYPLDNRVVGVSVVADNCTLADGLATAVMVMGVAKGLALIDRLEGVEGLIVEQCADGTLQDHYSKGFEVLLD